MLGYRYALKGAVVAGNRLGRTIGFPTANMRLYEPLKLIPVPHRDNAFLDIDPEKDWNYEGIDSTLKEYMEKHSPKKDKQRNHER